MIKIWVVYQKICKFGELINKVFFSYNNFVGSTQSFLLYMKRAILFSDEEADQDHDVQGTVKSSNLHLFSVLLLLFYCLPIAKAL